MKKTLLSVILFVTLLVFSTGARAEGPSTVERVDIIESINSIDLKVEADKEIPCSVVNYMDGQVGLKFDNTTAQDVATIAQAITVDNNYDIQNAKLVKNNENSFEIKLIGNENLANKKINIHKKIRKPNIIVIEEPKEKDIPKTEVISINTYDDYSNQLSLAEPTELQPIQAAPAPQVDQPISMQAIAPNPPTFDTASAQQSPEDRKFEEALADQLLLAQAVNDERASILDVEETSEQSSPQETDTESEGTGGIMGFLGKYWLFIVLAVVVIVIIGIVALGALVMLGQRAQQAQGANPQMGVQGDFQQQGGQQFQQEMNTPANDPAAMTADTEDITFIPPGNPQKPDSIAGAVNKLIFLRNNFKK